MATSPPAADVTAGRADSLRRDRIVVALVYVAAWFPMLVNRGLYWDDWILSGQTPGELLSMFGELGLPIGGYVYAAVGATPLPGLVGHALAFATYLLSTLLFHAILVRVPGLTRRDAVVAAVVFAVLPVNYARMALIDLMYAFSLLAFLAATWLLLRYLDRRATWMRIAALVLFLFSFYTASLLVLYAVPLALGFAVLRRSGEDRVPAILRRSADFLALPVVYWVVKAALWPPHGVYTGYNALTTRNLLDIPSGLVQAPWLVLGEPLARAIAAAGPIGIGVGLAAAGLVGWRLRPDPDRRAMPALLLAGIGVTVLVLGVFAYLAVGRVPEIWDWSSRHQLLVPLGAGLVAAAVARGSDRLGRPGRTIGLVAVSALVGIAVVADLRTLLAYQVDWFKQEAIVETVRATPTLASAHHVVVTDRATALNALRRTYRFYEYNALFGAALGGSDRLVVGPIEPAAAVLPELIARPRYHMADYRPGPVDARIELLPGEPVGLGQVLRLLTLEATGSPDFAAEVSRLIRLGPLPPTAATSP